MTLKETLTELKALGNEKVQLSAGEMDKMVRSILRTTRSGGQAASDRWAVRAGWDLTAERVGKSPDGLDGEPRKLSPYAS